MDGITGKLEKEEGEHSLNNFGSVKSGQKYLWVSKHPGISGTHASYAPGMEQYWSDFIII